jgi:hypothetical protein
VLIALALEQGVTNLRDRARTADIRASMNEEVADFAEVFAIRVGVGRCITAATPTSCSPPLPNR